MLDRNIVTKSNDLIEAEYKLNTTEQRIILMLASNVQPHDVQFQKYKFQVEEVASLLGLTGNSIYEDMKAITQGLLKKTFSLKSIRGNGKESLLQLNWLASAEYYDGFVELEFSPKLMPYFLQIKEQFTSFLYRY